MFHSSKGLKHIQQLMEPEERDVLPYQEVAGRWNKPMLEFKNELTKRI